MPDPESTEYGPVIHCRPKVGCGAPPPPPPAGEQEHGLERSLKVFLDPARVDAGGMVRALAIESADALLRDQIRGLMRVFGLRYDEIAAICRRLAVSYNELAAAQTAPPG